MTIKEHDFIEIDEAVSEFKKESEKPTMIIAITTKGKGVSFMENNLTFHGTAPDETELALALEELNNG